MRAGEQSVESTKNHSPGPTPGFSRGRSSVIAEFLTSDDTKTHMSLADFQRIVPELAYGGWSGSAFYKKVGDSYFLYPIVGNE